MFEPSRRQLMVPLGVQVEEQLAGLGTVLELAQVLELGFAASILVERVLEAR